jgi:hypothetical protein
MISLNQKTLDFLHNYAGMTLSWKEIASMIGPSNAAKAKLAGNLVNTGSGWKVAR